MKIVDLFDEVTLKTTRITVSNHDYKILSYLQYCGGYKRFGLDVYNAVKQAERQKKEMLKFLKGVFANHKLVASYFR